MRIAHLTSSFPFTIVIFRSRYLFDFCGSDRHFLFKIGHPILIYCKKIGVDFCALEECPSHAQWQKFHKIHLAFKKQKPKVIFHKEVLNLFILCLKLLWKTCHHHDVEKTTVWNLSIGNYVNLGNFLKKISIFFLIICNKKIKRYFLYNFIMIQILYKDKWI